MPMPPITLLSCEASELTPKTPTIPDFVKKDEKKPQSFSKKVNLDEDSNAFDYFSRKQPRVGALFIGLQRVFQTVCNFSA